MRDPGSLTLLLLVPAAAWFYLRSQRLRLPDAELYNDTGLRILRAAHSLAVQEASAEVEPYHLLQAADHALPAPPGDTLPPDSAWSYASKRVLIRAWKEQRRCNVPGMRIGTAHILLGLYYEGGEVIHNLIKPRKKALHWEAAGR